MRWVFAIALALHGIAHLVGFAVSWQLLNSPDVPYKTTLAAGAIDVGGFGMKIVGVIWLALAVAFLVAAIATLFEWHMALPVGLGAVTASFTMCAVSLPEARIGLAINVLLAILLALGPRAGLDVYQDGVASRASDRPQ